MKPEIMPGLSHTPKINNTPNSKTNTNFKTKTKTMRNLILPLLFIALLGTTAVQGQNKTDRPSPPRTASAQTAAGEITIDYSSPSVKERQIWGDLVPYGEVWRTGANEATTITLGQDMKVGGQFIPAGKYSLFTIPGETEWTVILNSVWDQWGAYNYDPEQDVIRFQVTPKEVDNVQESLEFTINDGGQITLAWDQLRLSFEAM